MRGRLVTRRHEADEARGHPLGLSPLSRARARSLSLLSRVRALPLSLALYIVRSIPSPSRPVHYSATPTPSRLHSSLVAVLMVEVMT